MFCLSYEALELCFGCKSLSYKVLVSPDFFAEFAHGWLLLRIKAALVALTGKFATLCLALFNDFVLTCV